MSDFLVRQNVIWISDIDARQLTQVLREKGAQNGCLQAGDINENGAIEKARACAGLKGMDLAKAVGVELDAPEAGMAVTIEMMGQLAIHKGYATDLILSATGRGHLPDGFSVLR